MRRRNMYYATGMPGWIRSGYAPGWGMQAQWGPEGPWAAPPPAVDYPAEEGYGDYADYGAYPQPMPPQWPVYGAPGPMGYPPMGAPYAPDPRMWKQFLADQLAMVSDHLQWIMDQLAALEQEEATEGSEQGQDQPTSSEADGS